MNYRLVALLFVLCTASTAQDRPNILWLTSEDNSPLLGCYGDALSKTPVLDNLAAEGVLYKNAFANAPVCAPARCTIACGVYPPSLGTQHMRSRNKVPKEIRFLSQYLKDASYYCTNRRKTDYNRDSPPGIWDRSGKQAHWRTRKTGQPFFAVFNTTLTHESKLHRQKKPSRDPATMQLAPYHPDRPEIRRDYAQYYDHITAMDTAVGKVLAQLDEDGLRDNTIVFYYADHGGILTRSKRFLYDSGTRVPLIIRFGKNWQHLAPKKPGEQSDRCVSFVDLAPTVLSLVGAKLPSHMQGNAFLGEQATAPQPQVFLFRDRMDERYDLMRGLRTERFLYLRNYNPHRIYGQHLDYLWRMNTTTAWQQAYRDGQCNEAQSRFWEEKPTEELYDVRKDPHQIHNLAAEPEHRETLQALRSQVHEHLLSTRDSGFLPEGMMLELAGDATIHSYLQSKSYDLERILETAELATQRGGDHSEELLRRTNDSNPAVRYWAVTAALVHKNWAEPFSKALRMRLTDVSEEVRIVAAEALCLRGQTGPALQVLEKILGDSVNTRTQLRAINAIESLGKLAGPLTAALEKLGSHKDKYLVRSSQHALETIRK